MAFPKSLPGRVSRPEKVRTYIKKADQLKAVDGASYDILLKGINILRNNF